MFSLSKHQAAEYLDTKNFCMGHVLESVKKVYHVLHQIYYNINY